MAYRGYSYSQDVVPSEAGLKKDADAMVQFLRNPEQFDEEIAEHINPQLIFAHGRSLGGAVAIYVAQKYKDMFRGMIVENTFTSISDMADTMFPFLKPIKPFVLRIGWYSDKLIEDVQVPTFFVTGDEDEIVPYEQTVRLHEMANETRFKDLYLVKGGSHGDTFLKEPKIYLTKLDRFIRRCIIEYEPISTDEWYKSKDGSKKGSEMLNIQQEHNDEKVKIKSVRMPAGTLDKLKEDAKKSKTKRTKMAE